MGIVRKSAEYEKLVLKRCGLKYAGLRWCELGDQVMLYRKNKPAKKRYEKLGVEHVSLDLNGRHGALPVDLCKPVTGLGVFDVVTNYGTAEHVDNQYEVFKNIHNLCKVGGIIIHFMPAVGYWEGHSRYHYSLDFAANLAVQCQYRVIMLQFVSEEKSVAVCYRRSNRQFISKTAFEDCEET